MDRSAGSLSPPAHLTHPSPHKHAHRRTTHTSSSSSSHTHTHTQVTISSNLAPTNAPPSLPLSPCYFTRSSSSSSFSPARPPLTTTSRRRCNFVPSWMRCYAMGKRPHHFAPCRPKAATLPSPATKQSPATDRPRQRRACAKKNRYGAARPVDERDSCCPSPLFGPNAPMLYLCFSLCSSIQ